MHSRFQRLAADNSHIHHRVSRHDDTRISPDLRPSDSRLALVTTAGLHRRGDATFVARDQTYRSFPADTPVSDLVQSHVSLGFDRSGIQRDLNVVFPVDRMRELVGAGELGSLAATFYSFMGAQYPPYAPLQEHAREVGALLRADGVDVPGGRRRELARLASGSDPGGPVLRPRRRDARSMRRPRLHPR